MKKLFIVLALLFAVSASAGEKSEKPTFFIGEQQCIAALASGEYTTYSIRAQWRGKKIEGIVKPLEAPACIEGEVVGGRKWVVAPAGFNLRWAGDKPVAMEDCGGNPVYAIAYVSATPPAALAPTPASAKAECCPSPSVTRDDLLDAADRIAAAMPRAPEPVPFRWNRPRVMIPVIAVVVVLVVKALDDGDNSGRGPGGNTGPAF